MFALTDDQYERHIVSRIDKQPDGCWLWTGEVINSGYGQWGTTRDGVSLHFLVHRVMFERHRHTIPEGLELDHLCKVKLCCNPAHLEPVTHRVNLLRSEAPTAVNAAKTHCIQGHPFDEANTYEWRGRRRCRACHRDRMRTYYQRES